MPSRNEKTETSKKVKIKKNKRLSRKRSPLNYVNSNNNLSEQEISSQENQNNYNDLNTKNSSLKKKRSGAEFLVSDLSPKYIGFTSTVEGKRRNRSQTITKDNLSPITPNKETNFLENEGVILTNSLKYIKMTPINIKNDNMSSPSVDENHSTDFESPIEKLIKKNKEFSNLSSSSSSSSPSSSSNNQQDDLLLKNETPKKTIAQLLPLNLNKNIVIDKNENLILLDKDNDTASTNIISESLIVQKSKVLQQITIKKKKLKNFTKLVPLKKQNLLDDINKKNNIESSEFLTPETEIKNFKNTPQKIRTAQVVLHKSPQIERMRNEQQMRNKKNSKIFQSVQILSDMITQNSDDDNKVENKSNLDVINNTEECNIENDSVSKVNIVVENPDLVVNFPVNETITENCDTLNNENNNSEKCSSSEFDDLLKSSNLIKSGKILCNEYSTVQLNTNITDKSPVLEQEHPENHILFDSENIPTSFVIDSEITTGITIENVVNKPIEELKSIKNTLHIITDFDDICEKDLRTENVPITESPLANIEISNKNDKHMKKMVEVEKLPDDKICENNDILCHESPKISKLNNSNWISEEKESKEIYETTNTESSKQLNSDGKNRYKNDNNLFSYINKFTDIENSEIHQIENSELALENILYENDVLGTGSHIDEDLEIMNISSDFDSSISALETPILDIHIDKEILTKNNDEDIQIDNNNEKISIKNINNPPNVSIADEILPEILSAQDSIETMSNDLNDKNLHENDLIVTSVTEKTVSNNLKSNVSNNLKSEIEETIKIPKQSTIVEFQKPEQNLPTTYKTQTGPDNESFAYALMRNARSTKSPSSTDSAKGSSIDIETNFQPKFGEIFWARISKYPFWPCIVWPDPDGKTISIGKNGPRQHIRIHVKFFADNGRRSWIRKEDLMAYNGREDFERKKKEFWEQNNISKRNLLARAFLINESKKPLWNQAVIEASLVLNEHIEKRSEKFDKILEETRELQFFERRRKRISLNDRRSSLSSVAASDDILNRSNAYGIVNKRDRSPTPESPAFENVEDFKTFVKKRKLDLNTTTNFNQLKKTSSLIQLNDTNNSDLYDSEEIDFNGFTEMMTEFIQPEKEEEQQLFINLKEIWEIKLRSEATKHFNLTNNNNNNNLDGQHITRFSKRLTTLVFRRSLPVKKPSSAVTKEKSDKRKKLQGVPIAKVVEDIIELNKNYLFNGLKREPVCKVCLKPTNLYKCSGNCQSWIHEACADLPESIALPSKIKDRKSIQNNNNNNVIVNNSNTTTNMINTDIGVSSHVTGDENLIREVSKLNNEININENEILNNSNNVENIQLIEIICKECKEKLPPICYVCKENQKSNIDDDEPIKEPPIKCNINNCGKYFHPSCLKYWPQARLTKSKTKIERFICPSHTCQTCISDDPKGKFLKLQNCTKCILCPASYHIDSTCIPAGSKIITATELICPRHRQNKQILNTNWCFICSDGGNLVCCESCPTSFHLECLNIAKLPDAGYICEECETGRLPLYGELIWAKFGVHKWWPCITIPPPQIPKNLYRIKHNDFDFCVRFFGTNDHSWISRDRVFLYQEDDWRYSSKVKTNDKEFIKALEEANSISELLKVNKIINNNNDKKMLLVPTPYKKIYVNRPVPPVKLQDINVSYELNACDCNLNHEKPCDIFSGCLNRILMFECNPKICPAGSKCNNQMFEKRLYASVKVARTSGKGFGLVSEELIAAGTFVIEYVGELIDDNELKRRIAQKQEEKDENYYFLTMQHGIIIDAGPKGNMARFMNHSCEPNCETQKWNVNGNTRIGLFAINDIPPNTELTFNYNLECIGDDRKPCHCGAEKCAGYIGAKYKKNDKKNEMLATDTPKTEKSKSRGIKKNKQSLSSTTNVPIATATTSAIPKNS